MKPLEIFKSIAGIFCIWLLIYSIQIVIMHIETDVFLVALTGACFITIFLMCLRWFCEFILWLFKDLPKSKCEKHDWISVGIKHTKDPIGLTSIETFVCAHCEAKHHRETYAFNGSLIREDDPGFSISDGEHF